MSAIQSLEDWNAQFGDVELFVDRAPGGAFEFEFGKAYACRIKNAKIVKSQKTGDLQIELSMDVQGSDGEDSDVEVIGKTRAWLDLIKQPSDMGKSRDLVVKLTHKRVDNIMRVLSAAAPAKYSLYAEMKLVDGKKTYFDFNGQKMSNDDFNDRKADTRSQIIAFIEECRQSEGQAIEILEDALLYIEKVKNPKNEKYPYTNYYATKPRDVPVFTVESAPF